MNAYASFTVLDLVSFILCFPDTLLIEALTRKPHGSANNSRLTRNIRVKFKLVLTVFLGKNKLLMSQDIIYWSLILKTKQAENTRDIKEQTEVVAYFSGGDFFGSISFRG